MLTQPLLDGLAAAGRQRGDIVIAPSVPVAVADDLRTARDLVRPIVAWYLGAMGARGRNFYVELAARYGHGDAARSCQDLFLSGSRAEAGSVLTDELIDDVSIAATPATIDDRLAEYEAAGVDSLIVVPFGDRPALLDLLAHHCTAYS